MATVPINYLIDNFTDNVQGDTWSASAVSGSATKAETGGQARLTLPSSTSGTHLAYYRTAGTYDLTAGSVYINIDTMVSTAVAATAGFDVFAGLNILRWTQTSGTLKAQTIVAGVATDRYSVAWNASTYKYLRIRESGGNVLFDSSTNGTSWTNRYTGAAPLAVTELTVQFFASCGNVASPGSFRIEDINLILPALTTNWRWTQVEWPLLYRFRTITLAAASGVGYIATSNDGTTWAYYSGPLGSSSGGYNALTAQSTQAAAENLAVPLPSASYARWDLPEIVECRFIRLYHRSTTGSAYNLYEFYPRRLVQADDIEAESIRAINIAAGVITADKITATFTITGKNIQTASSGARTVMSGDAFGGLIGYSDTDTYDTVTGLGTYQVLWSKLDGKLYTGGGNIIADENGINIVAGTSNLYDAQRAYGFIDVVGGARVADIYELEGASAHGLNVKLYSKASRDSQMVIQSAAPASQISYIRLSSTVNSVVGAQLDITSGGGSPGVRVVTGDFAVLNNATINAGLNVGSATGAGVGEIEASGMVRSLFDDAGTTTTVTALGAYHRTVNTPGVGFGADVTAILHSSTNTDRQALIIRSTWATATDASRKARTDFFTFDTSARLALRLEGSGSAAMIGFLGASAVARPTVTGSRAGNAALASALTALANLGLITDSSSA